MLGVHENQLKLGDHQMVERTVKGLYDKGVIVSDNFVR